ncbi:hypothetical protein HNR62_002909 [Oceanisphaera litoralis]|uniref:DUF2796 domain-containing protein n=1 Tax=Oceanisphaera litoralis TaxID=225144 RepID=UPI001958CDCB|nr:DUF2796 domain-containing protein [Oceanisphaera litoralis]MBM7457007.1 hypothetical protein [Oceanisphaera litoralis]
MSLTPFALVLPLLPFSLFAQSLPGVHEHGFGRLSLALDQQQLVLELLAPAADMVGFEHAPGNDAELAQLTAALNRVQQAETLFALPEAAACRLIDSRLVEEDTHHHQMEEHKHDEHDEHDTHGTHGTHGTHDAHGHQDVLVQYRYHCRQPQSLDRLSTTLFEQFPSLTRLELQGIVPSGQIATTLTPEQSTFSW